MSGISSCGRSVVFCLKQLRLHHFAVLCLALVALSFTVKAQDATIVGTVTDPSGASVPNVKITITSIETGLTKTATTADSGTYVIPELKIGHYNARAEAARFKIAEQKDLVLQVGDRARIDFQMQLGGAQETVTVEANAVRVQTDSGEQSNVIVLALPVVAVGLLAFASLRLVGVAARVLTVTRSLGGRLARWQL